MPIEFRLTGIRRNVRLDIDERHTRKNLLVVSELLLPML